MTLLRAHTPFLSNPKHYFALPRVRRIVSSSKPAILKSVHRCSVVRCCAVNSVNNGGFEDSRDGGLSAASDGTAPSQVTYSAVSNKNHATQAPAVADSSDSTWGAGEASEADGSWTTRAESRIERVIAATSLSKLML